MTKNLLRISARKKQPWAICIFLTDKFECTLLGNHFRNGPEGTLLVKPSCLVYSISVSWTVNEKNVKLKPLKIGKIM